MENKKPTLLYVYSILRDYSNETCYLSQNEIASKITELFGIEMERKSIGSSLAILSNAGYDIAKKPGGGFALIGRQFDEGQLEFLVEAAYASPCLTNREKKDIVSALVGQESLLDQSRYLEPFHEEGALDCKERKGSFFAKLSVIESATRNGHKISFSYCRRNQDGELTPRREKAYYCNPYFLSQSDGFYYVLSTVGSHDTLVVFRLDLMKDIAELDENVPDVRHTIFRNFDLMRWQKKNRLGMHGEEIVGEIRVEDPSAIAFAYDRFGENVRSKEVDGFTHLFIKTNEMVLYYFAMEFGAFLSLIGPESVKKRVEETAEKMLRRGNGPSENA